MGHGLAFCLAIPLGRQGRIRSGLGIFGRTDAVIWLVPAAITVVLGYLVWTYTHMLDPYEQLNAARNPMEVQVVAQDWKWLFIYPEFGVASVNGLAFPSSR